MSNLNGLLSPFQTRFKDRLSLIGKDGVNGLLKQTLVPIEPLNAFGYWNKINKSYFSRHDLFINLNRLICKEWWISS